MESSRETDNQPKLFQDRSFWGMMVTQFLGAFNDNVYKQLMLLLALPAAGAAVSTDLQGWATLVFSLPFVHLSGFAGFLSDKYSKTPIIFRSKLAEILVMFLGLIAFYYYAKTGMAGTWIVLFLLGCQATFFGPGKYGILPEIFRNKDLPRANGLILMSTFVAIILGIVFAGKLYKWLVGDGPVDMANNHLWIGSLICLGIAVLGTLTAGLIRYSPPAQPNVAFSWDVLGVSHEVRQLLASDRPLLLALLVSSVFWMVASMAVPTVNRLGIDMLGLDEERTSILVGLISIGVMIGAPIGGVLCRALSNRLMVTAGLWGIVICLAVLGIWTQAGQPIFGDWGCRILLLMLGMSAAVYSVPLQVFLQDRPPVRLKGRLIATMNQANFTGMLLAGPLYQLFEAIAKWQHWPISSVFIMISLLVLPLAIFYRLKTEVVTA